MRFAATEFHAHFGETTLRVTDGGIWVPLPLDVLEKLLSSRLLMPGMVILDAGMGDGRIVAGLATLDVSAYGIEIDEALAARAETHLRTLEQQGLPSRWRVCQGDYLEPKTYATLGISSRDVDVFLTYADGNEQALADFVCEHAHAGATLAVVTADLSLGVSGLELYEEVSLDRPDNAPPFRLVVYRDQ